jgi:hypothetical protein
VVFLKPHALGHNIMVLGLKMNRRLYYSRFNKYVRSLRKKFSVIILQWNRQDVISLKSDKNSDSKAYE